MNSFSIVMLSICGIYYTYDYYLEQGYRPISNKKPYRKLNQCIQGFKLSEIRHSKSDIASVRVVKRYFDSEEYITAIFNSDMEILRINQSYLNKSDHNCTVKMDRMIINLPTPFKKGDIVCSCCEKYSDYIPISTYKSGKPFVISDTDNGIFSGCFFEWGKIRRDIIYEQDLDYYIYELEDEQRFLNYLSLYYNGEIGLDTLIREKERIMSEEKLKELEFVLNQNH